MHHILIYQLNMWFHYHPLTLNVMLNGEMLNRSMPLMIYKDDFRKFLFIELFDSRATAYFDSHRG